MFENQSGQRVGIRRFLVRVARILAILLIVPLVVLLVLLVLVLWILPQLLYGLVLLLGIWSWWCARGRHVRLVTSDSPLWHDYIEEHIRPRLPRSTIVLNWSHRRHFRQWRLSVQAFNYFAGQREYNPIVTVFRPFRWAKTFRFFKAFGDYKHGKPGPLAAVEEEMFAYLQRAGIHTPPCDQPLHRVAPSDS